MVPAIVRIVFLFYFLGGFVAFVNGDNMPIAACFAGFLVCAFLELLLHWESLRPQIRLSWKWAQGLYLTWICGWVVTMTWMLGLVLSMHVSQLVLFLTFWPGVLYAVGMTGLVNIRKFKESQVFVVVKE